MNSIHEQSKYYGTKYPIYFGRRFQVGDLIFRMDKGFTTSGMLLVLEFKPSRSIEVGAYSIAMECLHIETNKIVHVWQKGNIKLLVAANEQ